MLNSGINVLMKIKSVLIVLTALLVTGCSNQPRQVKASLPMVSTNSNLLGDVVPSDYNDSLSDPEQYTITHDDEQIDLGPLYISALGYNCRELTIHPDKPSRFTRIVCSEIDDGEDDNTSDWYLTPDINQPVSSFRF